MSDITLERLDERTEAHATAIASLQTEVKAIWRMLYWASGVCFGFGAVAAILAPKITQALGL